MFDPKYGYADDQTLWFKYGIKPIVAENAICYHQNPNNLREVYKQSRWIGASIDNKFIRNKIIGYFVPSVMVFTSPISILILAFLKCKKIKHLELFFPWMLVLMTSRYFGSIERIFRNVYLKNNVR